MPMDFLLGSQMPLDPLFQSIQCGPNIDITAFLKMNRTKFSNNYRCIVLKLHDEQIRPLHQKDMGIDSYKTDSVSSTDGILSSTIHLH